MKLPQTIRLGNLQLRYVRPKKVRCHAHEAQLYYLYLDTFKSLFKKRFWCGVAAVYLALSTPVSLAYAQPLSEPPAPKPISNPLLIKVADTEPLEPIDLTEQPEVVYTPPILTGIVSGCGDNSYANYIYMHESGCNTNALNSIGCYGIGQSCPAYKIAHCGADYYCQNAWFTDYANRAYGGWYNAYLFWLQNHWW